MPKGWRNKTLSFKEADAADMERFKFASELPNCTADVKALLDSMMAGEHKSFDELMKASGARRASYRVPEASSHEFTGNDSEMFEDTVVEVDAGQFL